MSAMIDGQQSPARGERGGQRYEVLPAPRDAMKQHQRRAVGRADGVGQLLIAATKETLGEHQGLGARDQGPVSGARRHAGVAATRGDSLARHQASASSRLQRSATDVPASAAPKLAASA